MSSLNTLANQKDQIATYIKSRALNYYIYYNINRITNINALIRYNLIITIYNIVISEYKKYAKRKNIELLL